MADGTYQSQVYFAQGGKQLVVGPGAQLLVQGQVTGPSHGTVWYVDSVHGSDTTGDGKSWATAFATLLHASAAATADNGDMIYLAPGHAETIVGAAGVLLAVAGLAVVGIGAGRQRPTFTFTTAAAASFDITAARVSVENIVLVCNIDAQTAMVNVSAADVTIRGCEIQTANATYQATLGILTTAAADRLRIEGNHFHGTVDAGTTSQIQLVGGDSIVIQDNLLIGACATTGNIKSLTTATTNFVIRGNFIVNQTADANNLCINMQSTATGLIVNNRMAVIDSTSPMPVVAAGAFVAGNYFTGAVSTSASTLL